MTYEPSQTFHHASAYLSSYGGSLSNATRLEIYGLFKRVTVGPTPNGSKPGLFDMKGKAKWGAWENAGKHYQRPGDAESKYIAIAKDLGWNELQPNSIPAPPPTRAKPSGEGEEEEDIWDENPAPRQAGAGQGLGVGVSVVSRTDEGATGSEGGSGIHSLILDGDATKLKEFIESNPGLDPNVADEYGYTPLHLASDRGHLEMVKLLLAKGADKSIKDPDDFTPKALAEIAGNKDIVDLL